MAEELWSDTGHKVQYSKQNGLKLTESKLAIDDNNNCCFSKRKSRENLTISAEMLHKEEVLARLQKKLLLQRLDGKDNC